MGSTVGYRVGSSRKSSRNTRIEYVTEGTFLGQLLQVFGSSGDDIKGETHSSDKDKDPFAGVGAIIVDEAHERSTTCDIILGMLKMHAPEKWPGMKIVITSATLDAELFSQYFYAAPVLSIPGRMFPVDIRYLPNQNSANAQDNSSSYVKAVVSTALEIHRSTPADSGDILCFLTGQDEVEKAKEHFANNHLNTSSASRPVLPLALYGKQMPEEQKLVFERAPAGHRKVIFATNVAETGVTVDGVRHVVDPGLSKESRYDSKRNVTELSVQSICQSSAIQRKGRAGRTAPGTCYRLYSQEDYDAMEKSPTPEVLSRPLPLTITCLLSMGIDPMTFDWIQSPGGEGLSKALEELKLLGAVLCRDDTRISLTELGELIALLQVDPAMARMVYHACQQSAIMGEAACSLVGVLSVQSSFYYRGPASDTATRETADSKHLAFFSNLGDVVSMYGAFTEWECLMNSYQEDGKFDQDERADPEPLEVPSSSQTIDLIDQKEDLSNDEAEASEVVEGGMKQSLFDFFSRFNAVSSSVKLEDEDDDATSESGQSVQSFKSDITEKKQTRFMASKKAKKWCRDHFLNNKSLGIALSTKNELVRKLKAFKNGYLWGGEGKDQGVKPTAEEIQRLVVKALFLNVSVQTKQYRGYEVLRNDTPTVGVLHPGSCLSRLANNSTDSSGNNTDEESLFPRLVVFHSMLITSRTFLSVITPIKEEWIKEESPTFYENVVVPSMSRSKCCRFLLEGVRLHTARCLFGKFGDKKKALESKFNCSLQYDIGRRAVEAWCTPSGVHDLECHLKTQIQSIRKSCLEEAEEVVLCDNTRAVFGAGGEIQCLLFEKQFVTLNINGLPIDTESTELKGYLEQSFGPIRTVELTYPVRSGPQQQKGNHNKAFAKVTFRQPSDASSALQELKGEVWRGHTLDTSQGGVRTSVDAVRSTQVVMSWAMTPSKGKGSLDFDCPFAANALLQTCQASKGLHCPVLQGLGAEVRIRANIPRTDHDKPEFLFSVDKRSTPSNQHLFYRINLQGLYPHVDEQDLEDACKQLMKLKPTRSSSLQNFKPPVRVCISRDEGQQKDGILDETSLSLQIAEIRGMIPLPEKLLSATSFFGNGNQKGRAGMYLQYNSEEATAQVAEAWASQVDEMKQSNTRSSMREEPLWMRYGQPIRLVTKFSSYVNVHEALCAFFKAQLDDCISQLSLNLKVTCRIIGPKKSLPQEKRNPTATIQVHAPNSASLDLAVTRLHEIFAFKVYTPRSDEEKHVLFSFPGRRAMVNISDKVTYLHWDNASRVVRVYGPEDKAQEAMQKITENVERIATLQQSESFQITPPKRRGLLAAWRELKAEWKNDVMSFLLNRLVLEVKGTRETLDKVKAWLSDSQFILPAASNGGHDANKLLMNEELCSICLCEVEEPSYFYQACDHGGCSSCLKHQFSSLTAVTVPATCFSTACSRCPLSWPDIQAVLPPDAIDALKAAALSKYVREHMESCCRCPRPDCAQILDLSAPLAKEASSTHEEAAIGGRHVAFCSSCRVEYCLHCSSRDLKPQASHKGDSCVENTEEENAWRPYFAHITEHILTLRCPSCQAPFVDFDGCSAVTCSCGKYFCGLCLAPQSNSSVCHAHVHRCDKNPHNGGVFIMQPELDRVHRYTRIGQLRCYLEREVPKGGIKRKLMEQLRPALENLGITATDVM